MAIKSLFLSAIAATVIINVCTLADIPNFSSAICTLETLTGTKCTQCNFLTFGQEELAPGLNLFCPNLKKEENFCCYDPSRKPFCCDGTTYAVTGAMWAAAIIAVIAVVCKIVKCLIT